MLRILGRPSRTCDGTTRRELLRVGGLSMFGALTLPQWLQAQAAAPRQREASAKAVILVNLLGGPSHIDMFDMKPDAPAEIRGEFRPIATKVPGIAICELMPRLAGLADKWALIPGVGSGGNPVPLQTFEELLLGIGADGSRAHSLTDACAIP